MGTAEATVATLTLPDGYYTLNATVAIENASVNDPEGFQCDLLANYDDTLSDGVVERHFIDNVGTAPSNDHSELTLSGTFHVDAAMGSTGYVIVACAATDGYAAADLIATAVSHVYVQN